MAARRASGGGPVCPACGGNATASFYVVDDVPVHSVRLMKTVEEAVAFPRGRIDLHHCGDCDFIFNAAFDESVQDYATRYEETQGFSSTFRDFHRRLAEHLIERWDVRGKHVLEIGCGKGDFLAILCELGGNSGVGYDPAFVPERAPRLEGGAVRFHREFFPPVAGSESLEPPDLVCCKMTLEHIPNVRSFLTEIRSALRSAACPVMFFQVPDAGRILRDAAYWDIYYEHCSYFTRASLIHLFEACGFEVVEAWTDYQDQYLMITAISRPVGLQTSAPSAARSLGRARPDTVDVDSNLPGFAARVASETDAWADRIRRELARGGSACVWGAGSKAVAFLSALGADLVSFAVDINPHKTGTYLPGSGLEIVEPGALRSRSATLVIAMNPVYQEEIAAAMRNMGVSAHLVALE